jgi:ribose/xylose/arabinose/galactoside ABC-type transport system permease subunit
MIPYIVLTVGICFIFMGIVLWIKDHLWINLFDCEYTWLVFKLFGLSLVVHSLITIYS